MKHLLCEVPENFEKVCAYFENDELAAKVWVEKYALKSSKGKYLEFVPSDMHRRLAKEFFRIEKKYAENDKHHKNLSDYGKERKPLSYKKIFNFFNEFKYCMLVQFS